MAGRSRRPRQKGWTRCWPRVSSTTQRRSETIEALLVIVNGRLVAEGYFNGGGPSQSTKVQSVPKRYVYALVGTVLEEGYIERLHQRMMDFFPEFEEQIADPRKGRITIRHLLQMRAGFP